jgi:hypothetical protein
MQLVRDLIAKSFRAKFALFALQAHSLFQPFFDQLQAHTLSAPFKYWEVAVPFHHQTPT